jgi:hypothetical protein
MMEIPAVGVYENFLIKLPPVLRIFQFPFFAPS